MIPFEVKNLSSRDFKRLYGVRRETFQQMVEVARSQTPPKKKQGRPNILSLENQVLLTLEYWREYRTYFHLGLSLQNKSGNSIPNNSEYPRYIEFFESLWTAW